MHLAAANHGTARVDGVPVVIGECDEKVAGVFGTVTVGVSDNGAFPVVVEEDVACCYVVYCVCYVEEAVVVVLPIVSF